MSKPRIAFAVLSVLTALAIWVVPYRFATEPGGGYYNFSCYSDECFYAAHFAPLIEKTDDLNVVNGMSEPSFTPQYYLEMLIRKFVTITGIAPITFFWIWRVVFPVVLGAGLLFLAATTVRREGEPWHRQPLVLFAAAAAWPLFYCLYDVLLPTFPLRYWLDRVPTNLEFLLTVLLFALFVRLLRKPDLNRALAVVAALALIAYARPYAILGGGVAVGIAVLWLTVTRFLTLRITLISVAVFVLLLLPLVLQMYQNGQSPEYKQWSQRYFTGVSAYQIHPRWYVHAGVAVALAIAAWRLAGPWRIFAVALSLTAASIPFTSGLPAYRAQMLHVYDRWAWYVLPAVTVAGLLVLGRASESWQALSDSRRIRNWTLGLSALSLLASGILAVRNFTYNFDADQISDHLVLKGDTVSLPAYAWVKANTDPGALFLVDDGLDWSEISKDAQLKSYVAMFTWDRAEFFLLMARRRCVFTERLWVNSIKLADMADCYNLQRGTFGMPMPVSDYVKALKHLHPDYVYWRRPAPIPRGYGTQLQKLAKVVYSDSTCEIWALHYE